MVYGTNFADQAISETFTFEADQETAETGALAFKTVNKITVAAQDGTGATFTVGFGELIGLPVMLSAKPLVFALDDGVIMTAPTVTADADELEKNVIDLNGSLDGSVYDIFFAI